MRLGPWLKARVYGLLVGGAATALAVGLYAGGRLDRIVLRWLDLNFRYTNRMPADAGILMIDINDYAVERVHRWPWPRRLHAELVNALQEFGARAVLMDIVFSEPMARRLEHPALSKDADVDPPDEVRGQVTVADAVRDDDELSAALRSAGNVYLAMYYKAKPPGEPVRRLWEAADQVLAADPLVDLEGFRRLLPRAPDKQWESFYHQARIRHQLLERFALSRDELAERLSTPAGTVERYLAPVKRAVAREIVGPILAEHPEADFRFVHGIALPGQAFEARSPDREDILRAYRSMRALRAAVYDQPAVPESLAGRLEQGTDVTAPLDKLARAACGVGYVTFETDIDGVVRRLPLVVEVDGRLVRQLGFAVACDLLGVEPGTIRLEGGLLCMSDAGGREFRLPIDADGKTLINWHVDPSDPYWHNSFEHLPVARIMELVTNRRDIEENQAQYAMRSAEAVELACGDQEAAYAEYEADVNLRNRLRRQARGPQAPGDALGGELPGRLVELDRRIQAAETQALEHLQLINKEIEGLDAESKDERLLFAKVRALSKDLLDGDLPADLDRKNAALQARNEELARQLKRRIEGKVCFVGYTAAAVSDFVNSPVFENMPGVLAHANVVNTLLQGRFPRVAPRWMNVLLILAAGAAVTLLTASRGPWVSLISVVLLIGLLLGVSFVLFAANTTYVASVIAAAAVFVCWAFITLYRQLTEERAKRQFSKALAQYTSPAVAAQIAEDASLEDLAPRPAEVTCFFSDLQGFTSISERLGAERTRELLNPYLEAMSQVLIKHRAIINKFMGDGIFAFFNPPILQCDDHAVRACGAALDSLAALERLKSEYAAGPLADDVRALAIRMGINSGTVFVGDYGSTSKLDYTCIGDAVNLAARLEPANKLFGTRIMISEQTRCQLVGTFEARPLGRLQVVGKREAVEVHELLGRTDEVDDEQLGYAEQFSRAVEAFQQRRWDQAATELQHCARSRPDDPAIDLYRRHLERHRRTPPPEDWNRGIELTAK